MPKRLVLLPLLCLAACSHEHRVVRHTPLPVPLLYLPGAVPITAAQRQQIESKIPPGLPPTWFILILSHNTAPKPGANSPFAADIFFIPDQQAIIRSDDITPLPGNHILRKGRYLPANSDDEPLPYVQVPDPRRAPNPVLLPELFELPLPRPAAMPDATVLQLLLLARSTYEAHGIPPDSPILSIARSVKIPNAYLVEIATAPAETRTLVLRQFNHYFTIDP
jgi:hypothetical protein